MWVPGAKGLGSGCRMGIWLQGVGSIGFRVQALRFCASSGSGFRPRARTACLEVILNPFA